MTQHRGALAGTAGLLVAAALAAGGCGGNTVSGPSLGDTGGTYLVAYSSQRDLNHPGQYDIFLYDLENQGFRLLSGINDPAAADSSPTLSSDGQLVAFVSWRAGGKGGSDIWLYSRLSQDFLVRNKLNSIGNESDPAFTQDSRQLLFVRDTLGHLRIRGLDGSSDTLVSFPGLDGDHPYDDWEPSPDETGARIAFVSNRNGNPDVFVYDAAGDSVMDLPDLVSPGDDIEPSITPDGKKLCFASNRAGGAGGLDLYLYDLDARTFITLPAGLNTAADERHPSIGRSGDFLAFQSDRAGGSGLADIWNVALGTGKLWQGTEESSTTNDIQPSVKYP